MQRNNSDIMPVEEIDHSTIHGLKLAESNLTKHVKDLLADWELPLTFHHVEESALGYPAYDTVASDILWIPGPFAQDFWSKSRRKPKPVKCQCTCGHKHSPPKGKEPNHENV